MKINDVEREGRLHKDSWSNCLEIVDFTELLNLFRVWEEAVLIKQMQAIKFQLYFPQESRISLKAVKTFKIAWNQLWFTEDYLYQPLAEEVRAPIAFLRSRISVYFATNKTKGAGPAILSSSLNRVIGERDLSIIILNSFKSLHYLQNSLKTYPSLFVYCY